MPDDEKMDRFRSLEALQAVVVAEINRAYQGQDVEVLVEARHKGKWKGRTRTNKLVHVPGRLEPGVFAEVQVTEAHPHHLSGRLAS